ncbi:MBL fold metallo-hydrolase [Psittacicella hinzii]|uniref:hydroxyacylglutathione hydrolase n=1 Tax=Psittacicella hinzii TaxID=2028575 RepID=A0A3A1YPF5_9GAMM|nr:MBL fold metallo-hydrolase [Psittacicella hinzii]RIY39129.1 hypothetical protein CKF58_02765 [Psittacicella hinzii]
MLHVDVLSSLEDNYIYAIRPNADTAIVVDPGEYKVLRAYLHEKKVKHVDVLLTHAHYDHVDGLQGLFVEFPDTQVYAQAQILDAVKLPSGWTIPAAARKALAAEGKFTLQGLEFTSLDTPGHADYHMVYAIGDAIFTGDLIFSVGVGKVLSGKGEDYVRLYNSVQKVKSYALEHKAAGHELLMFAGHEYTYSNMAFARSLGDAALEPRLTEYEQDVRARLSQGQGNTPVDFYQELTYNPFLRTISIGEFSRMRALKDEFAKLNQVANERAAEIQKLVAQADKD